MNDQELRKLLEELHGEIDHIETIDKNEQELLRDLGTHIDELLERSENSSVQTHSNTILQIQDTIDHLEITHPTLTSMLSKLLSTLSNAGI